MKKDTLPQGLFIPLVQELNEIFDREQKLAAANKWEN